MTKEGGDQQAAASCGFLECVFDAERVVPNGFPIRALQRLRSTTATLYKDVICVCVEIVGNYMQRIATSMHPDSRQSCLVNYDRYIALLLFTIER